MARTAMLCLLALQASLALGGSYGQTCKASPGSPDWPSEDAWAHLAQAVDDRLLTVPPPGAVCHPDQPTYNNASCTEVQAEWSSQPFHSYNPVSLMWGANNASCLPDPTQPCYPQGFPAYVINASTPNHVELGVQFAKQYNVRLTVKGGGHDLHNGSAAPGALEIWTSGMQDFQHLDSFQPTGCNITIEGSAAKVGAGIRMINLTSALDAFNETFPVGGGETISLGGYASSAGHSILCQRTGLAADNVLEIEMVSPDGELLTLNECQNTDLFWAARGGGGQTFGAITSFTIKTFPTLPVVQVGYILSLAMNDSAIYDVGAYLMSQFPYMETKNMTCYVLVINQLGYPEPSDAGVLFIPQIQGNFTEQDVLTLVEPIIQHVNETWPQVNATISSSVTYPSFYGWYRENYDMSQVGSMIFLGSRLLGAEDLTKNLTEVANAFQTLSGYNVPGVQGAGTTESYLISGKGVWDAKPRGGGNSVCPAWRKTLSQNVGFVSYTPNNNTAAALAENIIQSRVQGLRDLAPDMGVYQNEGLIFEPDFHRQFWGDNYDRLLEIKRKFDPDDVFWCHPCVGDERWEEVGYQLCRVE